MSKIQSFFPTLVYRADEAGAATLNEDLEQVCLELAATDKAGERWSAKHGYPGYTSYGSPPELVWEFAAIKKLEKILDKHAAAFIKELHFDIRGGRPVCDSLWVNVLPEGGSHTGHIHTNSVLSGTYYVSVPQGSGPLVFEDPRLPMMMAAPPRKDNAPEEFRSQVSVAPAAGSLLLWESWLRHEVPLNRAEGLRISISFNYVIGEK